MPETGGRGVTGSTYLKVLLRTQVCCLGATAEGPAAHFCFSPREGTSKLVKRRCTWKETQREAQSHWEPDAGASQSAPFQAGNRKGTSSCSPRGLKAATHFLGSAGSSGNEDLFWAAEGDGLHVRQKGGLWPGTRNPASEPHARSWRGPSTRWC